MVSQKTCKMLFVKWGGGGGLKILAFAEHIWSDGLVDFTSSNRGLPILVFGLTKFPKV